MKPFFTETPEQGSSYEAYPLTLAAGQQITISHQGRYFRILSNDNNDDVQVGFDQESAHLKDFPKGIGLFKVNPFYRVHFKNPSASSMSIVYCISSGWIDDSRFVLTSSTVITVTQVANTIETPAAITALQISYTIDNAAAVDKGGGQVGIPVTGHPFVAGDEITIAGTTYYDGTYTIDSQTTNEIVITVTYNAETFAGTETITPTPRSLAADTDNKEVILQNNSAYDIWFGDSNVTPANLRGTKLEAGDTSILSLTSAIYFVAVSGEAAISINKLQRV